MKTFRHKMFTTRNYDCTNVVACQAEVAPNDYWIECGDEVLAGLTKLWIEAGVQYYGYL